MVAGLDRDRAEVAVERPQAVRAVDDDEAAVGAAGVAAGPEDDAVGRREEVPFPLADVDPERVRRSEYAGDLRPSHAEPIRAVARDCRAATPYRPRYV